MLQRSYHGFKVELLHLSNMHLRPLERPDFHDHQRSRYTVSRGYVVVYGHSGFKYLLPDLRSDNDTTISSLLCIIHRPNCEQIS